MALPNTNNYNSNKTTHSQNKYHRLICLPVMVVVAVSIMEWMVKAKMACVRFVWHILWHFICSTAGQAVRQAGKQATCKGKNAHLAKCKSANTYFRFRCITSIQFAGCKCVNVCVCRKHTHALTPIKCMCVGVYLVSFFLQTFTFFKFRQMSNLFFNRTRRTRPHFWRAKWKRTKKSSIFCSQQPKPNIIDRWCTGWEFEMSLECKYISAYMPTYVNIKACMHMSSMACYKQQ